MERFQYGLESKSSEGSSSSSPENSLRNQAINNTGSSRSNNQNSENSQTEKITDSISFHNPSDNSDTFTSDEIEIPNEEIPNEEIPNEEIPDEEIPNEEIPNEEIQTIPESNHKAFISTIELRCQNIAIERPQDSIESNYESIEGQLDNYKSTSLYDSTRNTIVLKSNEPVLHFEYFESLQYIDSSPGIQACISSLLDYLDIENNFIPQINSVEILKDINESLRTENISREEVIFRLISELPAFFIKINAAITLDVIECRFNKNQKSYVGDCEYPSFIERSWFSSDPLSLNTYKEFLNISIDLIKYINCDIDIHEENKEEQKQEVKIFYKTMNPKLFEEADKNSYIQIIHFALFSSDIKVLQKY